MAKGTIHVNAELVFKELLRLSEYDLQDVYVERLPSGEVDLVFVVDVPELPGREDVEVKVLPIFETRADEDGTRWHRLKKVEVV